jgi:hypothetical protein
MKSNRAAKKQIKAKLDCPTFSTENQLPPKKQICLLDSSHFEFKKFGGNGGTFDPRCWKMKRAVNLCATTIKLCSSSKFADQNLQHGETKINGPI